MHWLSWNKRNSLVTKLVGFVEIFIFCHFVSAFPCEKWEKLVKPNKKTAFLMACEKKIDHWFSVMTRKCQPLGPLLKWETRQASFPIGTFDHPIGIFLSPLNISDGFYLAHMGTHVGLILPLTRKHKDFSIPYALVCEKRVHASTSWCQCKQALF